MKKISPYLVFFAAILWASDAPFRSHLTKELSSSFIVLAEHFVDILIILPVFFLNLGELKNLSKRQWLAIIVIGVGSSALASIAFTQAFHYVNPSVAIVLQKLQPFIVIGLAYGFLKERFGGNFWIPTTLAIVGAYLISFPNFLPQVYAGEVFNPNIIGVLLALSAAVLWGLGTVLGKYVLNNVSFKMMTSLRFIVAFVFLLILNISKGTLIPESLSAKDILFIFLTAITSGVVALFIYYKGLKYTSASVATIAELGFPLGAVAVNAIFLDTHLSNVQLFGMALLLYALMRIARVNNYAEETAIKT